MKLMHKKMAKHVEHKAHVCWHKQQVSYLLYNLLPDQLMVKADFIQNIVHTCGWETSFFYYSKHQTQLLSCVVWYKKKDKNSVYHLKKNFLDYLSSYITHNSMFFQIYQWLSRLDAIKLSWS